LQDERKWFLRPGILQATVVIAWLAAFVWLGHGSGGDPLLGRFIRSDYWWLVYTAIGILIAFAISLVVRPPRQAESNRSRGLLQMGILFLPLFYLPLAVTSELSTQAAEKRSLYTPRAAVARSESPKPIKSEPKRTISTQTTKPTAVKVKPHEATLLDLVSDPEDFEGTDTTLVGIVHRDKRLPHDAFYCYRLVMVCCAADATPAGVIVKSSETPKLKKGTWVKVHGKVTLTTFEGSDYPAISADKVEKTSPPKNPFLLPQ